MTCGTDLTAQPLQQPAWPRSAKRRPTRCGLQAVGEILHGLLEDKRHGKSMRTRVPGLCV